MHHFFLKLRWENGSPVKSGILSILIFIIRMYQYGIAPLFPTSCRHQPTCSHYTVEALNTFGIRRGLQLSFKRICQCRPGGSMGYDPVPAKKVDVF